MSLDFTLTLPDSEVCPHCDKSLDRYESGQVVFEANITHNLTSMADVAGLYRCLWHPEDIGITTGQQMIKPLEEGLESLMTEPDFYKQFEPMNRWGTYEGLVRFTSNCLGACRKYPTARVSACV